MKKLIVANWKLNPQSLKEARRLAKALENIAVKLRNVEAVVCPPFVYLGKLEVPNIKLGAQDCFWKESGAYTGEISPKMLKAFGVKYVIIGHSERRQWLRETDEMVGNKCSEALKQGIIPILCVGEPSNIRKKGRRYVTNYVYRQLAAACKKIAISLRRLIVVAYEPIWAIGTGNPCDPDEAEYMVRACSIFVSERLKFNKVRALYGGSVNGENARYYLGKKYIEGLLVGGASLNKKEFTQILKVAEEKSKVVLF